jgi:predicted homoserine dehydrogenase-like protein
MPPAGAEPPGREEGVNLGTLLRHSGDRPIRAALVGTGEFGRTFIQQARRVPGLVPAVLCDQDLARARQAAEAAGVAADDIVVADDRTRAESAIEAGRVVVVQDPLLAADLPVDIVIEATGQPHAAAALAERTIANGRHLAMVTKECEIVVGPILAHMARAAGVVHTPVDGDQPSLLIGLVAWAGILGLPVVAAGKSSESDVVYDPATTTVTTWGRSHPVPRYADLFGSDEATVRGVLADRVLSGVPLSTVPDLCEMGIVANHTGLMPDRPDLHAPIARTVELPWLFRPEAAGGLLAGTGVVDMFNCLRRIDELSFAGGVFVTVETPDARTGRLLAGKGIPATADGRHMMLHNPVHLLGAEAVMSVLAAVRLGRPTGSAEPRPRIDLVAEARRDLLAGEQLLMAERHEIPALQHLLKPAQALGDEASLPYYLAAGARLRRNVRAGALLTLADVEVDPSSALLRLRREQDRVFLT